MLNDTIRILFPEHLLFQKGSSTISTENHPLIERFAKALNLYSKTSILSNGYTDNLGSNDFNMKLSDQRSENANNLLKKYDVSPGRLMQWGMGPSNPIADNNTDEGRRKNRRVEFIMLYRYEP